MYFFKCAGLLIRLQINKVKNEKSFGIRRTINNDKALTDCPAHTGAAHTGQRNWMVQQAKHK